MLRAALGASLVAIGAASSAFGGVEGLYRFPTTNGNVVVFAAEGDLWQVPVEGGMAMRLTTDAGQEAFPKFSMDGSWLAFSAEIEGNIDVYAMPIDRAGEPVRLTYHPMPDSVVAWTPDGKVVFRSQRDAPNRGENRLYEVAPTGGTPTMIPVGLAALADISPDGDQILFNRKSWEFATWKRYRGGTAQDIWLANLKNNTFTQLTDFPGTDRFPMWFGGRVYFVSDRAGRLNLFSMAADGSDVRQLTNHTDYDADWPDMHNGLIVYTCGADLWMYDTATGRNARIPVTLPTDRLDKRDRFENPAQTLEGFDLSKDGKRVLVNARGEMWNVPVKGGRTIAITQTSGVREREGSFSPDAKQVLAISDATSEQEVTLFDAAGKDAPRSLTSLGLGWLMSPVWSPDGKKVAFADLDQRLHVMDADSGDIDTVDVKAGWEITDYEFSPDSKSLTTVSTEFTGDHSPAWDPNGKYLYFVSSRRYDPIWGWRDYDTVTVANEVLCAAILQKDGVSPFLSKETIELYSPKDEDKDTDADDADGSDDDSTAVADADSDDDDDADDAEEAVEPIVIDVAGIENRIVEFPVEAGNYFGLVALKDKLLFGERPVVGQVSAEEGEGAQTTLYAFDFDKQTDDVFLDGITSYDVSDDGSTIAWTDGGAIKIASTASAPSEPANTVDPASLRLQVDPTEEWTQIFWEAWRLQRDFYWASNMAGLDWESVGSSYAELLPRIGSRQELNWLIGQMIGELGTSHTYIWGGDAEAGKHISVGMLGADVVPDAASGYHRITRVLRPEPFETNVISPLAQAYAHVDDGSYLFAINNHDVPASENIWKVTQDMAGEEVLLTIGASPDRSDARDVQVKLIGDDHQLRYCDWVRTRRQTAMERSSGRIGYIHLPDMGTDGLVEFVKAYYPQLDKDALIIDCRYNGGGNVSQMIMSKLARKVWAYQTPRRGASFSYPEATHVGPKVLLTNYFAGSDGDIGPQSFRLLGIGPIIGTRSWGGVVGIRSDKPFIDGGMSTQPEFAWWEPGPNGGWTLENHGVDPDVVVDILPADSAAGRDPQLDAAIDYLVDQLGKNPPSRPAPPPLPDKSVTYSDR